LPTSSRPKLVQLTERGEALFAEANRRWLTLADALAAALGADEAARAAEILRAAREHLHQTQTRGEEAA
jgi:DNA-binding MarR family transcriptional regulator